MTRNAWAATDVGQKRSHNEDAHLVDSSLGLYLVADGVGGHTAGDVASAHCVKAIRRVIAEQALTLESLVDDEAGAETLQRLLTKAVQKASTEIAEMAESEPGKRGMGTKIVGMLIHGRKAVIAHVGDSRVYVIRGGTAHQLTEDHSMIEEHIKRGLMTREEAERSWKRHVVTRAVGFLPAVEVDTLISDVQQGDIFLLCTDGLHSYLRDIDELSEIASKTPVSDLAAVLTNIANKRGGKDNITAVVIEPALPDERVQETEVNLDRTAEILRRIPLFQYMNYKELVAIMSAARKRHFQMDENIVQEGEVGDQFFVVLRGKVEVRKGDAFFTSLTTGGHFGEMALLDQEPRSASVRATEPTSALVLSRDDVMQLMRKDSLLAVKLLWAFSVALSERLRATNETVTNMRGEIDRLRVPAPGTRKPGARPFGGQW